jgi:hypothetical protein
VEWPFFSVCFLSRVCKYVVSTPPLEPLYFINHNCYAKFVVWISFYLGGEVYLKAEKELNPLKQGAIEICFPLIRWKMFETYLEDVDEAVEQNT